MLTSYFLGVLNGPDIRRLIKSASFDDSLDINAKAAWDAVKRVIAGVLGKHRAENLETIVHEMLAGFELIGVHMSLKIHFLHYHLDFFMFQSATESDEHGERFHQDIMHMEHRYRGKSLASMLADFCWSTYDCEDVENDDDN